MCWWRRRRWWGTSTSLLRADFAQLCRVGGLGAAAGNRPYAAGAGGGSGGAALYGEIVAQVNGTLANFETMKRFRVVPDEWLLETGELTPSLKLKRRVITEKYAA
jgi:hypothetical protein